MQGSTKKLLTAVLTVVLTAVCVLSGILLSDQFGKEPAAAQPEPESEIHLEALPMGAKATMPAPIRGTKLFVQEEQQKQTDYSALFSQMTDTGFNCIVLSDNRTSPAFSSEEEASETLSTIITEARKAGFYTVIRLSGTDPAKLSAFAQKCGADALILPDLYGACLQQDTQSLFKTIHALDDAFRPTGVSALLWDLPFTAVQAQSSKTFMENLSQALEDVNGQGIYTEPITETDSSVVDFEQTLLAWKDYSENGILWISQSEDFTTAKSGYARIEEVLRQISSIYKQDEGGTPVSTVFCAFSDFNADPECVRIVRSCMVDHTIPDAYLKSFAVTNHNRTSITTDESKVTFAGEASPMHPLQCNGAAVPVTEDGYFSAEYSLKPGSNTFTFTQQGKSYTYKVQYNMDLIKSIVPSGSMSSPGGSTLEISVVAHRQATVYATLNGSRIDLIGSSALLSSTDSDSMDTSSDYVTFTGRYNLPESRATSISLGSIKAYATYKGSSDSITGATVTVTALEKVDLLPVMEEVKPSTTAMTTTEASTTETSTTVEATDDLSESESGSDVSESDTENGSVTASSSTTTTTTTTTTAATTAAPKLDPVITPYQNHGLAGTKRMCKVTTYYAETMPLSPLNDLSVPLSTPLPAGTFDFITGESSFDKYTYYNLGSGKRIYRKDVEVIEKAYTMPANTIFLVNSGSSGSRTDINLHLKWKVPFNAVLNGQHYINDPKNKREYAVTSMNASSLDITFYYTADVSGQPNVTGSGVVSACEWIRNASSQTCTLRLHLRSASRFYGYSARYNADDTLCISIKERTSAGISGKTVMLDPGHGGADGGASCVVNSSSYNEASINLMLAEKTRAKLQAMGANVVMTRTNNTDPKLDGRKRMAREQNPDIFVSIHCDASSSSSGYGTTGFYYRPYSQPLAKAIHSQLVSAYINTIYGTNKSSIDRGTIFYPYSVTRIEECPSVLIECGFVTNMEECKILQNAKHQDTIATAIANGIRDYFANN